MASYKLPNHPSLTSPDLLGSCNHTKDRVSQVKILTTLLQRASEGLLVIEDSQADASGTLWRTRLEQLVRDIAHGLHGVSALNAEGLRDECVGKSAEERRALRTNLFASALRLDELFPAGEIQHLSEDWDFSNFSSAQVDCLLSHMFLGTLQIAAGNTRGRPGFSNYYNGNLIPLVRNTALPYLETIVQHFIDGGYDKTEPFGEFSFRYSTAMLMPDIPSCDEPVPQLSWAMVDKPVDPSDKDDAYVLVAANAQPGPDAGGTHEERLVGQSPAMAIASLLTPRLAADAAVITSPLPVHATWEGHASNAKMLSLLQPNERPWRRYIIADAMELDLSHRHPELLKNNVDREVRKLYAAFEGACEDWRLNDQSLDRLVIEMPPWGCGAFGGRLTTKMPCMAIAAGLAHLTSGNLELLVPREPKRDLWKQPRDITVATLYDDITNKHGVEHNATA